MFKTDFGYLSAGLPNITGSWYNQNEAFGSNTVTGAIYNGTIADAGLEGNGGTRAKNRRLYFDASRSSSLYGNSATVQPPAVKVRIKTRYQ